MVKRVLARANPATVLKSRRFRDYALITLGAIITAWGLDAFLIPNRLAAGGVSGLATVIFYFFREVAGITLPVGVQMLVMNAILLALAVALRGWRYGAKTIYGMIVLSVAIDGLAPFTPHLAADDRLLAVLFGGAVTGIGMGFVFKARGNTGGTDIVAQLLSDRTNFSVGQLLLMADAVVILIAGLYFGPELALYGAVAVFVMTSVIDVVQEGFTVEKAAFIVSARTDEIAEAILHQLQRGATGLAARGLFSGAEREVILTVVSRRELDSLKALVHAIDPQAFVIITDVREALGEGFREIGARV